jgi:hypothetical protein
LYRVSCRFHFEDHLVLWVFVVTLIHPIYILCLGGELVVVFPKDKADIPHSDFWENTVAPLLAAHFSIPLKPLLNLPYCQRRARVSSKGLVFYGEQQSAKLLRIISKATGEPNLGRAVDEHEVRLPFDFREFERLLAERG